MRLLRNRLRLKDRRGLSFCFPGTGTPEAGGVTFPQLLTAILQVAQLNVVAADLNELAPMLDPSGASTAMACKVLRELLLALLAG